MKVFMLGWEFPPHISGGLGTACYGMTKALDAMGVDVCFVLPTPVPVSATSHVQFRSPADLRRLTGQARTPEGGYEDVVTTRFSEHVELRRVPAVLQPYASPEEFEKTVKKLIAEQQYQRYLKESNKEPSEVENWDMEEPQPLPSGSFVRGAGANYGGDLMTQVNRYAMLAGEVASHEKFDVVHAHDWMTYPAGVAVSAQTGKPLVVHVHSTEFDRSGSDVNQQIYNIERAGMHAADKVVCVSHLTANLVIGRYGVPAHKVEVVYNAVDIPTDGDQQFLSPIRQDEKLVLFLGRVTMQKGPEYFLRAARKVADKLDKVRFVVAGSGDMIAQCIREVADLKLGKHVTFTGFLRGRDVDRVFQMADLYVMPSVSEPFGIAPLEALSHNVPVLISKQSGVSEVLTHALKVDFWDIDEMANKILAVLRHPPLQRTLRQHGAIELGKLSWPDSAAKLRKIYGEVIG
ncbi:MAG: glycosyltransferase [Phycisphaerae bacterium]